jgi:phosphonate transport system substrate-binding protein
MLSMGENGLRRFGKEPPRTAGRLAAFLLSLLFLAMMAGCLGKGASSGATLVLGVLPDEEPKKITEKSLPLAEYLEERLGREVEIYATTDYASLIVAFENKKVDLAWFGGLSYLKAREKAGAVPLVTASREGSPLWHSVFLSHPGSGLRTMEDLKEKKGEITFAFGDPASTSGSLMPTYYLAHVWGIEKEKFGRVLYTGAHDATALAVVHRQVDAGVLNNRIFEELVDRGTIREEDFVVLWETPEYADYVWAVQPERVSSGLADQISEAFLAIRDPAILAVQRADRYVPVSDEFFRDLRKAAVEQGFLEGTG